MSYSRGKPTLQPVPRVKNGSIIDVVEYDLASFRHNAVSDWEHMTYGWLEKGADVSLYCQAVHPEARGVLTEMARHQSLRILDYSRMPDDKIDPPRLGTLEKMKTFHFTLFNNPRQMWLEGKHPIGSDEIQDCEWLTVGIANGDVRYYYLAGIVHNLRKYSTPMEIGSTSTQTA